MYLVDTPLLHLVSVYMTLLPIHYLGTQIRLAQHLYKLHCQAILDHFLPQMLHLSLLLLLSIDLGKNIYSKDNKVVLPT